MNDKAIFNGKQKAFSDSPNHQNNIGLTKREYFAAMAMQGFASNQGWAKTMSPDDWDEYLNRLANGAVEMADALLLELEKPTTQ